MELYQIIATCNNYTGEGNPRTLLFIPENFNGVKITQKFNFVNPMGYTPSFSVETMKAIEEDKAWLDSIFDTYGLQSKVTFEISKLNATATGYTVKNSFLVDFESYSKHDLYSEFALKSISCLDEYNKTKNTARNFTGATPLALPDTMKLVNYVSVKKTEGKINTNNTGYLWLEENNDSTIHNNDTATYGIEGNENGSDELYRFGNTETYNPRIAIQASGQLTINFIGYGTFVGTNMKVNIYKNDYSSIVATLATKVIASPNTVDIEIDFEKIVYYDLIAEPNDYLFIGIAGDVQTMLLSGIYGNLFCDIWVETQTSANQYNRKINYLTAESVFDTIFAGKQTTDADLQGYGIASAQSIMKRFDYISLIPKDFLTDFCLATGSLLNFDNIGGVKIQKITTFFDTILQKTNALDVLDYKELTISPDVSLNFVSVSAGMEQKTYDYYSYLNNWNKILTFSQAEREASENLNLVLTKFRVDISGIFDYINKIATSSTDTSSDLFLFDPNFYPRSSAEGFVYDVFTPRDILINWTTFLRFCFLNFGLDFLEIFSDGGDSFNLNIEPGVKQFDVLPLSTETENYLLPLKVSFSCLINEVDFTSKILKVTHNGVDLYVFVTDAQTTDSLEEQKITGNLIYFAP